MKNRKKLMDKETRNSRLLYPEVLKQPVKKEEKSLLSV
jgi:hypothetical protein